MIMGLALFTQLALAGTLFYVIHNMVAKTNLFLVGGAIQHLKGSTHLRKIGGLYKEYPFLSILFLISAMSLAGIPPLSGFFAKFILLVAALRAEQWLMCGVGLFVGLLTLYSMTKIWANGFWAEPPEELQVVEPVSSAKRFALMLPIVVLAVITICMGLGAMFVFEFSDRAAVQLLDRTFYIEHVLNGGMK
jgi:multicomponent Na+:H+ antiporter subunit D